MSQENTEGLGIVTSGSLNKGVEARLDGSASVEDIAVGGMSPSRGKNGASSA